MNKITEISTKVIDKPKFLKKYNQLLENKIDQLMYQDEVSNG